MNPLPVISLTGLFLLAASSSRGQAEKRHLPYGVYGVVEKLVMLPNDVNPAFLRLEGAFLIGTNDPAAKAFAFNEAPRKGYLYYAAPRDDAGRTRVINIWKGIQRITRTYRTPAIALGPWSEEAPSMGSLREAGVREAPADAFPANITGAMRMALNSDLSRSLHAEVQLLPMVEPLITKNQLLLSVSTLRHASLVRPLYFMSVESKLGSKLSRPMRSAESTIRWAPGIEPEQGIAYTCKSWIIDGTWKSPVYERRFVAGDPAKANVPF